MDPNTFKSAARVTFAYMVVLICTIGYQGACRIRANILHERTNPKQTFNRYGNQDVMLAADRSVGNFLEWMGPFLSLFWLNLYLNEGRFVQFGWVYIGARILYPFLATYGGISLKGPRPLIYLATLPGYGVIFFYAYQVLLRIL